MSGEQPKLEITASRRFHAWLAEQRTSLALTTYRAGKLFLLGVQPNGRLAVFERSVERAMGMFATGNALYVSTLYQLWRFQNMLGKGQHFQGHDAVFVPRESRVTGDLDIHDLVVDAGGTVAFCNTLFNCVGTTDDAHSFRPLWKPPWINGLVAEDRCHLNGLALRDGAPRYATAVSRSDVIDGWRHERRSGGVVVDMQSDEIVCEGLSMPHSPRWYRERLWVINSGTGYFGRVDLESRTFEPLVFLPGYARGLAFIGKFAVVGLSDRREDRAFRDLDLEDNLAARDAETRCGLLVIDLEDESASHWLRFEGYVREIYDVVSVPGVVRPMAIGFRGDEIQRYISFDR